jgi:hypothetical protein
MNCGKESQDASFARRHTLNQFQLLFRGSFLEFALKGPITITQGWWRCGNADPAENALDNGTLSIQQSIRID